MFVYLIQSQLQAFKRSLQGQGPYAVALKKIEGDIKEVQKRINEKLGKVYGMYHLL